MCALLPAAPHQTKQWSWDPPKELLGNGGVLVPTSADRSARQVVVAVGAAGVAAAAGAAAACRTRATAMLRNVMHNSSSAVVNYACPARAPAESAECT
ncbi:MAG: hypothetical protein ACPIOQ_64850, partial [Promethearchaeia archaeon]